MFFVIPTGVNYETNRLPTVTFSIIGLNVALYLVSLALFLSARSHGVEIEAAENDWLITHLGLIPSNSPWYTWITCLFVHAGFFHLLGNMIFLFLFGSCVEDLLGRWQYLLFYLAGGLAADFLHIIVSSGKFDSTIPLVGASGAISACLGGFVLLLHRNHINFQYFAFIFFRFYQGQFALPAWLVLSWWFLKDLLFAYLSMNQEGGGTAFAAHVGGFLAGMGLVGIWKLIPRRYRGSSDDDSFTPASHAPDEPADIYLFENGTQIGPFNRKQIREMISMGSVSGEALFWREGMADWAGVNDL